MNKESVEIQFSLHYLKNITPTFLFLAGGRKMVYGWTQIRFFGRKVGKTRIFEVCLFIKKTQVVSNKTESEPHSRLYNEHIT